jgi:transcriptional regulator with XRE-family HTH domain
MATKEGKREPSGGLGRGRLGNRAPSSEPVGKGLRRHREEAGMSLRALARAVGVSPSLISQIEHGKATPSVATLYGIVFELGISLDDLFFDQPRGDAAESASASARTMDPGEDRFPSSHWQAPSEGPVLRSGNRLSLTLATGVRWERLTAFHEPGVEFLYCSYPVGGESAPADELMTHDGSEYGIVLDGRCGATVGEDHYQLEAGDSIAFHSRTPHRIWNLSEDEPMLAIWTVVGRDGDPRVD